MYQFLESIRISNCQPCNLDFHQKRVDRTFAKFYPNVSALQLDEIISAGNLDPEQTYKCRIEYDQKDQKIEYLPYTAKKNKSFSLVDIGDYEYDYKYSDRSFFTELRQKHKADELLLSKNGFLTDSTYANLVFYNSELQEWHTPDTPLLNGTMRQKLLKEDKIIAMRISVEDLGNYSRFALINAMLNFNLNPRHNDLIDLIKIY